VVVVPSADTVVLTGVASAADDEGTDGASAAAATPEKARTERPDIKNSRTNFI
jgi:hypothetical protein